MDNKKQVFSGIQPTGPLHLGRYFGAIENWVKLQEDYNCIYCVVDYHAITMPYNPAKLRNQSWDLIFSLIACGVKPENLFIQSMVPEHAELSWILGCVCSYGELSRMTQFKDKSALVKDKEKDALVSSALFTYPVLQAADILIYHADYIPVGKDQEQHLELSRNIRERFNNRVKKEYFPQPEPLFTEIPKVMSPADPTRKMSASLGAKHYIDVFSDEKTIRKQIMSAVTDSGSGEEMSPGLQNLLTLLKATGNQAKYDEMISLHKSGNLQYKDLKEDVADAVVQMVLPIQEGRQEIISNKKEIKNRIKYSASQFRKKAAQTLSEVKELSGLLNSAKF
jgi:tryptophanyl-tRNA synthetase